MSFKSTNTQSKVLQVKLPRYPRTIKPTNTKPSETQNIVLDHISAGVNRLHTKIDKQTNIFEYHKVLMDDGRREHAKNEEVDAKHKTVQQECEAKLVEMTAHCKEQLNRKSEECKIKLQENTEEYERKLKVLKEELIRSQAYSEAKEKEIEVLTRRKDEVHQENKVLKDMYEKLAANNKGIEVPEEISEIPFLENDQTRQSEDVQSDRPEKNFPGPSLQREFLQFVDSIQELSCFI